MQNVLNFKLNIGEFVDIYFQTVNTHIFAFEVFVHHGPNQNKCLFFCFNIKWDVWYLIGSQYAFRSDKLEWFWVESLFWGYWVVNKNWKFFVLGRCVFCPRTIFFKSHLRRVLLHFRVLCNKSHTITTSMNLRRTRRVLVDWILENRTLCPTRLLYRRFSCCCRRHWKLFGFRMWHGNWAMDLTTTSKWTRCGYTVIKNLLGIIWGSKYCLTIYLDGDRSSLDGVLLLNRDDIRCKVVVE